MIGADAMLEPECPERLTIDHQMIGCLNAAGHATDHYVRTHTGQEIRWISANRIPAIWQDGPTKPADVLAFGDLDAIADRLAARLNLAIVQQVPQRLLDSMREGYETVQPGLNFNGSYSAFRFERTGNVLTLGIELNGQRLAAFRFEGDNARAKVPEIINGRYTGRTIDAPR